MAMNWIKFDTSTPDKPEVWSIATDLQIDPDAVVGKLLRIWTWFDDQSEQGNAPTVTKALLDRKVCVTGFCDAVIRAGWMVESGGLITLPNFERHNGQTAKTRAQTAKRVAQCKKSNAVGNAKVTVDALPKEEKRREENTNTHIDSANSEFLKDPEFVKLFEAFKDSSRYNHHWSIAESTCEAWLMGFYGKPIEEAKEILRQSTMAGAKKPIFNSVNRTPQKTQSTSDASSAKKRELLEALGVTE